MLFFSRRYGKTSLIKQVLDNLSGSGVLVFYLDLYRITSLERFAAYYSKTVMASLRTSADRAFSLIRSLVPSLKPKLTYTEPNVPSIEIELSMEALRKQSTLSEMLDFLENYCREKSARACVVFDEFQEITTFDTDGILEREMRSAFQHHERVAYAFAGSKTHLMHELFEDKNRPFYNFGSHLELGLIEPEHWIPFVKEGLGGAGMAVSDDQVRSILDVTRGHPYYTQMLCSEIWEILVHGEREHDETLVPDALRAILVKESHAFVEIWDSLSRFDRRLLLAMAESPTRHVFAAEFMAQHRLGAASSVQRAVQRLTKRGIIRRTGHGYRIIDPLFVLWMQGEERDAS
jgi:hypothetical protein